MMITERCKCGRCGREVDVDERFAIVGAAVFHVDCPRREVEVVVATEVVYAACVR
jgi:hypothetical protein